MKIARRILTAIGILLFIVLQIFIWDKPFFKEMVGKIYSIGTERAQISKDGKYLIFKDGSVTPLKNPIQLKDSLCTSKDSVKGISVTSDGKYIINKDGSKTPLRINVEN